MGLTANVVANTPILSAWGNEVRDRSLQVFASTAERTSQWPTPPTGAMSFIAGSVSVYNGTAWVTITPIAAAVATSQTTTSTGYTDLATGGPVVTIQTGAKALVTLTANIATTVTTSPTFMSFAVSGATTIAASDTTALAIGFSATAGGMQASQTALLTGLTPGVNVFTAKYKTQSAGTATFVNRVVSVVGLL